MLIVIVTLLIACPLAGLLAQRWTAVILPLLSWPLLYLGLRQGWWGDGLGDGWHYPAVGLLLTGLLTTATSVAVGRRVRRARSGRVKFT
jgi:hypothetical protein